MINKLKIRNLMMLGLLVFPASNGYRLEGYSFGGGGSNNIGSTNYQVQGGSRSVNGSRMVGESYGLGSGLVFERQSSVPLQPSLVNDGNYYNQLHLILNNTGQPTDVKYAIAISSDNFVSTQYVKADQTVGESLGLTDYQTYGVWGGASGFQIIGLDAGTTYSVKVKSIQGSFTESEWGPIATASTVNPSLTFDIDVAVTDQQTEPPFLIELGDLIPGSVNTSSQKVWLDIDTNAAAGGNIYVYSQNNGLYSVSANYSIGATSANLDTVSEGFGIQGDGVAQSAGGPLSINSPFNGGSNIVGAPETEIKNIFGSLNPVTGGRASFLIKAKSANDTPSAADYSEVITVIASANF